MLTKTLSGTATFAWTPAVIDTENYTSKVINQYTAVAGQTLTCDGGPPGNGNLTSDSVNCYAYDRKNRLISAASTITITITITWYHTDHQGSTVAMINASGAVVETCTYDEFGNSDTLTGNPWRYAGHRIDDQRM